MGCKAITPHLVSLASRLEGKPFHLVASHCQSNSKEEVVSYIKSKGVAADSPNFTVTKQGRHPAVKGNGHVPYYAVFDHHGRLVHDHMCGSYHGGDGLKMIEWVDELLKAVPAIYLGAEPFEAERELATRVEKKKRLGSTLVEIAAALAGAQVGPRRTELERMITGVELWRDRELTRIRGMMARRPSKVLSALSRLSKDLSGSALGIPVESLTSELKTGDQLAQSISIEKNFKKIQRGLEKKKPCKNCKRQGLRNLTASCAGCRRTHKASIAKAMKKLDKLTKDKGSLAIAATVAAFRATFK